MDIKEVKCWVDKLIELLESNPLDTIQKRIVENRIKVGIPYMVREEVKEWVVVNKPGALNYVKELNEWLVDYYKYFETGYKAKYSIDELPEKILGRLRFIREKLDSL